MEIACAGQQALLTMNRRHFIRLHVRRPDHLGIIVCGFDPDFARQAQRIDTAVASEASLHGKLLRVYRPSS